jgi:hypothetical protein
MVAVALALLAVLSFSAAQDSKGKKHSLLVGVREHDHAKLPDLKYEDGAADDQAVTLPDNPRIPRKFVR